jgi:hypothetical protein
MLKPLFTTLLILVAFIVPDSASAAVTPRFAIEPGVRAANATFQRAPVVPTTKKYVFAHHMVSLCPIHPPITGSGVVDRLVLHSGTRLPTGSTISIWHTLLVSTASLSTWGSIRGNPIVSKMPMLQL